MGKKLGDMINKNNASMASVSADGQYLFFTKNANIYWVDTSFIKEMAPVSGKNIFR